MTIEMSSANRRIRILAAAVSVVGICVALVIALFGTGMLDADNPKAKVLTAKGLDTMIADLEDRFGTTRVVELSLFDDYAIVELPVAGGARRVQSYQYDGEFDEFGKGTSRTADESSALIDLAELDVPATLALLKTTPEAVGLPDEQVSNVTIRLVDGPSGNEMPLSYVMVESDHDESGFVRADLSGKVVDVDTATD